MEDRSDRLQAALLAADDDHELFDLDAGGPGTRQVFTTTAVSALCYSDQYLMKIPQAVL